MVKTRLSHSTIDIFHQCPRKFHLSRNFQGVQAAEDDTPHLTFGSAVGTAIEHYLRTQDFHEAAWLGLTTFDYSLAAVPKTSTGLINCLETIRKYWDFSRYEVLGHEVPIRIDMDDTYYCGFIDLLLYDKQTAQKVIVEIKTTGAKQEDLTPLYKYSPQALLYSTALEEASYTVLYIVFQLKWKRPVPKLHILPFNKTRRDRLEALLALRMDYEAIKLCYELDFFPKRYSGCFTYGRPCEYFGICDLSLEDAQPAPPRHEPEWAFRAHIDELIEREMGT